MFYIYVKTNHLIFILRFLFAFFLFAMQLSFSQQEWTLPCSDESFYAGSFCYSSNLPFQNYVYISSDDGSAVNLSIIQGLVELNMAELIIYDSDDSVLYNGNGNGGNVGGLSFQSLADSMTMFVNVNSESDCNAPIIYSVSCIAQDPCLIVPPSPMVVCDDDQDGINNFNLTEIEAEILDGLSADDFMFSYYLTEIDAQLETNSIENPESYYNITNPQDIYVRVVNIVEGCINVVSLTIVVSSQPSIPTLEDEFLCNCDSSSLVNFQDADNTFEWFIETSEAISGFSSLEGFGDIPSFTLCNLSNDLQNATVSVFVTDNISGCQSAITYDIIVAPEQVIDSQSIVDIELCNGDVSDEIIFQSLSNDNLFHYEWMTDNSSIGLSSFGYGNIPSFVAINETTEPIESTVIVTPIYDNSPLVCAGESATFTITVYPEDGCELSINNNDFDQIFIYPNPTENMVFIEGLNENFEVYVFDIFGKLVMIKINQKEIDITGLSAGNYIFKVISGENLTIKRVIVK